MPTLPQRLVRRPDGELAVFETGAGAPLILLHGWPLDHRMFQHQFAGLAHGFRLIAPDRRGFGRSSAPPNLSREPDDLAAIMDSLCLDTAHLLGMSQGGRVALRFAASHPGRLRSLVLQGAAVDGLEVPESEAERVPLKEFIDLARDQRLAEVKRRWLNHPMMTLADDLGDERQLLEEIVEDYQGCDLLQHDPAHYQFRQDVLAAIDASDMPVLLLSGARESAARKAHAQAILHRISSAREVVLPNSGHLGNLTEPERYNQALKAFCRSVDTSCKPATE